MCLLCQHHQYLITVAVQLVLRSGVVKRGIWSGASRPRAAFVRTHGRPEAGWRLSGSPPSSPRRPVRVCGDRYASHTGTKLRSDRAQRVRLPFPPASPPPRPVPRPPIPPTEEGARGRPVRATRNRSGKWRAEEQSRPGQRLAARFTGGPESLRENEVPTLRWFCLHRRMS